MHKYLPQLFIVIFFDVQNIPAKYIPEIMDVANQLGVEVHGIAFWRKGEKNQLLDEMADVYDIEIVYVNVKKAGDQAVDREIRKRIKKGEFPQEANAVSVAASDNGYLKVRDLVRLSNRLFINFRKKKIGKDHRGKYDFCYDLIGHEHEPNKDISLIKERLGLILALRLLENHSLNMSSPSE